MNHTVPQGAKAVKEGKAVRVEVPLSKVAEAATVAMAAKAAVVTKAAKAEKAARAVPVEGVVRVVA